MSPKISAGRKEDFFVRAKLGFEGESVIDVPCKVFLPLKAADKPEIILKPSLDTYNKIKHCWKGTLEADVVGLDGDTEAKISASEIYLENGTSTLWGRDIVDVTVCCDVENLEIINYFPRLGEKSCSTLLFWISQNPLVTPYMSCETSFDGNVKRATIREQNYLIGGRTYFFEKHFRSSTDDNGDFRQSSFLVAKCLIDDKDVSTDLITESILGDLDDFLLLSSFASESRTVCMGWEVFCEDRRIRFYRGNISFPSEDVKPKSRFETLVDVTNFKKYILLAQNRFSAYDNKLSLRSALHSSLACKNRTIESNILTAFSGLETLLTEFRVQEKMVYIMEPKKFSKFKKSLQKHIKQEISYELNSTAKSKVYSKIDELNRVSLADVYAKFLDYYEVRVDDLWPLFGDSEYSGLSEVRNKIIHGDPFPNNLLPSMITAQMHLNVLLDRCLLAVLGWGASKSNVCPDALCNQNLAINYNLDDISSITNYIRQ